MEILEYLIYVYFFIAVARWVFSFVWFTFIATNLQKHLAEFKITLSDNILWVAPVVYFSGGLA